MKTYGLIGKTLSHSFSKQYFEHKFKALGISNSEYRNFELKEIGDLRSLLDEHPNLAGLNVTIPYKSSILPYLDDLSDEANKIGAVNCIEIQSINGKKHLTGHNTDWYGFQQSLTPIIDFNANNSALILGTGGASKAIAYALLQIGISYQFVSRSNSDLDYDALTTKHIMAHNLIINTTPVGTFPDVDSCPILPYDSITSNHVAFDVIYNPKKSLFLSKCEAEGATIKNGYEMLTIQAEKGWQIWNDK